MDREQQYLDLIDRVSDLYEDIDLFLKPEYHHQNVINPPTAKRILANLRSVIDDLNDAGKEEGYEMLY